MRRRVPLILLVFILAIAAPATALSTPAAAAPGGLTAPASDAAWARAAVAQLPVATEVNDANGNKLFDTLEDAYALAGAQRLPVVVSFRDGTSTRDGLVLVHGLVPGASVSRAFSIIPAYAGELGLADALRVARLDAVRQIELDVEGTPELDTATVFSGADAVVDEMGITGDLDGNVANVTATDIGIAVLDTGFDSEHMDLAGSKIIYFNDIAEGKEGVAGYDSGNHGTHVASIAAGTGAANAKYRGVAPGASIIGIKISGGDTGTLSNAIAGYEWIVEHKDHFNIRVATMSFGFGTATDGTTALERAVDAAWNAGIVTFKSTGNSGPERGTITVPAAARGIISVGAMLDPAGGTRGVGPQFGFQLAAFSSRGPTTDGRIKPDIAAPGVSIMAAMAGTKDEYTEMSGTSMAAPFAAGAAALVIAANPQLTPDEVKSILLTTAEDWGIESADVDYGHGRLQVRQAVMESLSRAGRAIPASTAPVVPFHEVRVGYIPMLRGTSAPGTFEVNDTTHPIAATFIGEGRILSVMITDPDDVVLGTFSNPAPDRQHVISFKPTKTGTYGFMAAGTPGTTFVVDFSHGTAQSLLDLPVGPLESGAPEDAGTDGSPLTIPSAGGFLALAMVGAAAALLRRR